MDLILKFTDESESFSTGVEFGRILNKMELGNDNIDNNKFPIRIENKDLIERACIAYEYTPVFGQIYFNEWIDFMAIKNVSLSN